MGVYVDVSSLTCFRLSGTTTRRLVRACSVSKRERTNGDSNSFTHSRYSRTSQIANMPPNRKISSKWTGWNHEKTQRCWTSQPFAERALKEFGNDYRLVGCDNYNYIDYVSSREAVQKFTSPKIQKSGFVLHLCRTCGVVLKLLQMFIDNSMEPRSQFSKNRVNVFAI